MHDAHIAVKENNLGIDHYKAMELIAGWIAVVCTSP
jgi:hypothetical protein